MREYAALERALAVLGHCIYRYDDEDNREYTTRSRKIVIGMAPYHPAAARYIEEVADGNS